MALLPALFIQGGGGTPSYDAADERAVLGAVVAGNMFDTATAGIGVLARGHGVLSGDSMAVTSSGANDRTVNVAAGLAAIRGTGTDQDGIYVGGNDAVLPLALPLRDAVLTRRDLVIAQIRDNAFGVSGDDLSIRVVQGIGSSGTPVDPTVPASSIVLARVRIPSGSNPYTVDPSWIDDLRPHARPVGGIQPVTATSDIPTPEPYDWAWDSTGVLRAYLDGSWREVARDLDTNWTTGTPDWDGTFTLGNGSHYLRYVRYGVTVFGVAGFVRGSTSSGSGNLRIDLVGSGLPAVKDPATAAGLYLADGRAYSATIDGHYTAAAEIDHTDSRITTFATGGHDPWNQAFVGRPFPLVAWDDGDHFRVAFRYEAA